MLKYVLLFLALVVGALSLLTIVRAPDNIFSWWMAILAGEFGHWVVLAPILIAIAAAGGTRGAWRGTTLVLCVIAVADFLRPAVSASRIAATLPEDLGKAFGEAQPSARPFSWARLYLGSDRPKAIVTTEVYAHHGDEALKLDLYRPGTAAEAKTGRRPCVLVIHGGGWDSGNREQLSQWNDWLVAHGYLVAAISYRLAPKYQWPAQREDALAALAWLKAHADEYGIDAQRFVVLGRSAGGQIATAVAYGAKDPALRGVIALYAPHDMPFVWSVSREDDVLHSLKLTRQYMGGPPEGARMEKYISASGQLLAGPTSPPTLLVHGTPDTLAWVKHSSRLSARLEELKVPHYFLELPWATHAFDFNPNGPSGQLNAYAMEWFLQCVTR